MDRTRIERLPAKAVVTTKPPEVRGANVAADPVPITKESAAAKNKRQQVAPKTQTVAVARPIVAAKAKKNDGGKKEPTHPQPMMYAAGEVWEINSDEAWPEFNDYNQCKNNCIVFNYYIN